MENKILIVDTKINEYKVSKEIKLSSSSSFDIPRFVDISRS